MRGKPNRYTAKAVRLFGQIAHYDLLVNHVLIARYVRAAGEGFRLVWRESEAVRLNPALVNRALADAR